MSEVVFCAKIVLISSIWVIVPPTAPMESCDEFATKEQSIARNRLPTPKIAPPATVAVFPTNAHPARVSDAFWNRMQAPIAPLFLVKWQLSRIPSQLDM